MPSQPQEPPRLSNSLHNLVAEGDTIRPLEDPVLIWLASAWASSYSDWSIPIVRQRLLLLPSLPYCSCFSLCLECFFSFHLFTFSLLPVTGTGLYNICGGRTVSTRLLSLQPTLELQTGKKAGTPKTKTGRNPVCSASHFGAETIIPKPKLFITELDIHTKDRSQSKLKEYEAEGETPAQPLCFTPTRWVSWSASTCIHYRLAAASFCLQQ